VVPIARLDAAAWLVDSISEFGGRVEQLMPGGFESFVRVFHRPDQGFPDVESATSWAEVAVRHGAVFHPEAQWTALTGGRQGSPHHSGPEAPSDEPTTGSLDPLQLARLSRLLAAHTTTPDLCHYALWNGTGKSPRAWDAFPTFRLPGRAHWLFGPVAVLDVPACSVELQVNGIEEQSREPEGIRGLHVFGRPKEHSDSLAWVRWEREHGFVQSPSWWWPEDRAWVVHSEVDYDSTLVGGSCELSRALVDDPELECLEVTPATSLMAHADQINSSD
jgi:hypothetical protein